MSDRFESYETTLRNCLTESKEALTAKGVSVPETTKLRNVPSLIDGIQVGHQGNAITINCKDEAFIGQTLTAKHTDGTTVTKVIDSLTAIIEIPKDGEWTVTNSLTSESIKFTFDTIRDLYVFQQAYIKQTFVMQGSSTWNAIGQFSFGVTTPSGKIIMNERLSTLAQQYNAGTNGTFSHTGTTTESGTHTIDSYWMGSKNGSYKKEIFISDQENNKTYEVTITSTTSGWKDSAGELPNFDGQESSPEISQDNFNFYIINTTDMTESQKEEIFNEIDEMIVQNKSDEEINAYISSKEAEYGQV